MSAVKGKAPVIGPTEASVSTLTSYRKNDMTYFNSLAASTALVPVFTGTIDSQPAQLCNARELHAFMAVLRDFTTWIKGRISKFDFIEGVDFVKLIGSPDLVNQTRGGNKKETTDYHLTLDMAKELAMVENNDKGREARRYFIECEKQVLVALTTHHGDHMPNSISPAQAQHLTELVQLVVESGKQSHGETWARLHRKMKVNGYLMLRPDQFDAACQYLRGKFDDASIATLIQKHLPNAVPNTEKNALQALPEPSLKNRRWLISFDHTGREQVQSVPCDAFVMNFVEFAKAIVEPGGMMPSNVELANLAAACNTRLAERLKYQDSKRVVMV